MSGSKSLAVNEKKQKKQQQQKKTNETLRTYTVDCSDGKQEREKEL